MAVMSSVAFKCYWRRRKQCC